MNFHLKLEDLKKDLVDTPGFDLRNAFAEMDVLKLGHLDARSLKLFLRRMGSFVHEKEIFAILRRLDLDGN